MKICDAYDANGFKIANRRGDWFGTRGTDVVWNLWEDKWVNDLYDCSERGVVIDRTAYKLLSKKIEGDTIFFFRVAKVNGKTDVIDSTPHQAEILYLRKEKNGLHRLILKKTN